MRASLTEPTAINENYQTAELYELMSTRRPDDSAADNDNLLAHINK